MRYTILARGAALAEGDRLFMHGEWVTIQTIRPMTGDPDYDRIAEIRGDDMCGRPDLLIDNVSEFHLFCPQERGE